MLQTNTTSNKRNRLRKKIEPFGGWKPDQLRFCVSWHATPLTFAQIMTDLKNGVIKDLKYFRKLEVHHFPDLLQQGWLRLWQALHENNRFLAHMPLIKAIDFVANRCGTSVYMAYFTRYASYHDFTAWEDSSTDTYEDNITDIVIGSSLKSSGKPGHARFTRTVDRLLDITKAIVRVAQWCGDDMRKLAALYYLTTNVTQTDAGRLAGLPISQRKNRKPRCQGLYHWSKIVLKKLQEELQAYRPIEPNRDDWKEQIKAGKLEPVITLAKKYEDDTLKLLALYCLTTSVARTTLVKELGMDDSKLWYAMKQLRQQLRCLYASRLP